MAAEQARNLSLDGLRQKRARAVAQNLGQRIAKSSWLRELENISVGHGVSLLCWRSGGLEHPHDTPPYPFTPSPTFVHSSMCAPCSEYSRPIASVAPLLRLMLTLHFFALRIYGVTVPSRSATT